MGCAEAHQKRYFLHTPFLSPPGTATSHSARCSIKVSSIMTASLCHLPACDAQLLPTINILQRRMIASAILIGGSMLFVPGLAVALHPSRKPLEDACPDAMTPSNGELPYSGLASEYTPRATHHYRFEVPATWSILTPLWPPGLSAERRRWSCRETLPYSAAFRME